MLRLRCAMLSMTFYSYPILPFGPHPNEHPPGFNRPCPRPDGNRIARPAPRSTLRLQSISLAPAHFRLEISASSSVRAPPGAAAARAAGAAAVAHAAGPGAAGVSAAVWPTEGLRAPFIYALAQDRQGYLWLGTGDGLLRYDGSRFVSFTRKDGLAEDFVVSLREDPATGALWVGHYQGGISVRKTPGGPFRASTRAAVPPGLALPADGPPPADTAAIGRYQRRYAPAPARRHHHQLPARRPRRQRLAGHRRAGPVAALGPAPAAGAQVARPCRTAACFGYAKS